MIETKYFQFEHFATAQPDQLNFLVHYKNERIGYLQISDWRYYTEAKCEFTAWNKQQRLKKAYKFNLQFPKIYETKMEWKAEDDARTVDERWKEYGERKRELYKQYLLEYLVQFEDYYLNQLIENSL